jgi:hypothetical protein
MIAAKKISHRGHGGHGDGALVAMKKRGPQITLITLIFLYFFRVFRVFSHDAAPSPETDENQHKRFAQHIGPPRRGEGGKNVR